MNFTTKTKVIIGFIIAVFISVTACLLSYNSLKRVSSVVDGLSKENLRLTSIKKLLRTIDFAEAEVDNYILNKRASKLDTINFILNNLSGEVEYLKGVCKNNPSQLAIVYTIDSLTTKQIDWYYGFINFKSKGASDAFFKSVSSKLEELYKAGDKKTPPAIKEKQNFFSRILNRSKKSTVESADAGSKNSLTPNKIHKIIDDAQYSHMLTQKTSTQKELALLKVHKELKNQLYGQVNRFEVNEIVFAKQKAEFSKANTKRAIISLSLIAGLGILSFIFFSFFIIRDITKGNKLKSELIASRREAIRLARTKEEFLANMSHEIRTPLNSIIGFAEQLNQAKNEEDKISHAQAILKSSKHLLTLINDILDFSKINIGKITIEKIPFSIKEIINDMEETFSPLLTKKGLAFHSIIDEKTSQLTLDGDPHRMKQILLNLISNALKFTEKGTIEIIATHKQLEGNNILLQVKVKDTGIGINPDSLQKIFNSFDQADNSITRKFGGTGLGLSICKQLAEVQGGEISVNSQLGAGSEFMLSIPYPVITKSLLKEIKIIKTTFNYNVFPGKSILVVDDDEMSTLLMTTILKKHAIPHQVASNGSDGLLKYKTNDFDLILTDINMPEISGFDLLKEIKSNKHKIIPVIAVTANVNKADVKKYLLKGFDEVLLKPYKEEELLQLISRFLSNEQDENNNKIKELHTPAASFSINQLSKISNDSEEFIVRMLEKFIVSANECSEKMISYFSNKDWASLSAIAHKSIPSYAMMDIKDVVECLQFIEKNLKNTPDQAAIENAIKKIEERNLEVISDIKNYLVQLEVAKNEIET